MSEEFHGPDVSKEEDEKLLQDAQPQGRIDWSEIFWKPKSGGFENVIRILPGKGKATYHLKMGRHFIKHEDRTEMFFCNLETYGEECEACTKRAELLKAGDKTADFYKPDVRGVFNVVDYEDEGKVKLWEAPPVAVWVHILNMVRGKSRYNNVVGTEENPLEGRDIVIFYDSDAQPQNMYKVQFEATSTLKAASAKKWLEEAKELLAEDLYPRTSSEVARIKTFGSVGEREELRKKLAEQAAGPKGEAVETAKEIVEEGKEDELEDEVAKAKKVLADAEARKAEKEKEKEPEDEVAKAERILAEAKKKKAEAAAKATDKPAEKSKEEKKKETPEDVKRKVDEFRKKHQA